MSDPVGATCPLQCGQCCDYWQDIASLLASTEVRSVSCPNQGDDGCRLPRESRPRECLLYFCGVARAVLVGQISHDEGIKLKEHCYEAVPVASIRRKLS